MVKNTASFERLGELVLEEILVRAGIEQPKTPNQNEHSVSLDFRVLSDARGKSVAIEGHRYDGSRYTLRLELD